MMGNKKRVLCFGDSNTWGYVPGIGTRYQDEERYPGVLAEELGGGYRVIEEGLCGRTTVFSDLMEPERCGITHLMPIVLSQLPLDYMIIMLGTNDTKTHFHVNAEEIGYGMEELLIKAQHILRIKGSNAKILLISPVPIQSVDDPMFNQESEGKSRGLAKVYKTLADTYDCLYLDAGCLISQLGTDGIHMTKENHKALGEALARIIKEYEKEVKV